jgi:OOP family OmpA-OmpF porin
MLKNPRAILAALALATATPALAQNPGSVEIGVFGRYTWFDSDLDLEDDVGIGGRLGITFARNLGIEADASYTYVDGPNDSQISYIPIHARLLYAIRMADHADFLLGAGYTHTLWGRDADESEAGFGGLVGLRLGTPGPVTIRVDLTGDYVSDPKLGTGSSAFHLGLQGGLSYYFGRRSPAPAPAAPAPPPDGDQDGDGVRDSADNCPNTPAGDQVDASGCSLPKDADGDGVVDASDRCPNTPAGTPVDANGCPRDSDGDGVLDNADRCPNTPAGTPVDANGCPRDSDRDGVIDANDRCPDTPAGTAVDANGCPKDSDGDGVLDNADRCPDTPAGTRVDQVGCTAIFEEGKPLILKGVNFETGKATLLPASTAVLDTVATSLINNPNVTVEIGGHTDNTGSRATNTRLSLARAEAVKAYLVSKGVPAERMTTKGYGPDQPIEPNTTAAGRAANRRVELTQTN